MSEIVKFENIGNVTLLTLNDPDRLNALSLEMISELHRYVKMIINNELKTRCLVITGAGRGFCAGANLIEGAGQSSFDDIDPGKALEEHYHPFLIDLKNLEIPLITAVNGVAAGAGASLAIACDIIIASENASFIQAFGKIGLIPDSGGTYILPRLIGLQRACLLYTSDAADE